MNLLHVLDAENGYIVSKSLLKSTKKEQEWTYTDDGYISTSDDFKNKSRIEKRTHKDENGQRRTIEEKVVIYWSSGLNSERIQKALNKWKVDLLSGDLYRFMDVEEPDLKLILDAFEIKIPVKLYRRAELKTIKTDIRIFI